MPNEEKAKKIKAEIDLLYKQLEVLEVDEPELEKQEEVYEEIEEIKPPKKKFDLPKLKNPRLMIVLGIIALFLFPVVQSLVNFGINKYQMNIRDAQRVEILNRIGFKFEEFKIAYQLYPFMIADEKVIKVYSESIKNRDGGIIVPAQTQEKLDISEYGFEKLEIGRSGCQAYPKSVSADTIWICFEQDTKELGILLEKSPNSIYLNSL
jgi:hypothetical protein